MNIMHDDSFKVIMDDDILNSNECSVRLYEEEKLKDRFRKIYNIDNDINISLHERPKKDNFLHKCVIFEKEATIMYEKEEIEKWYYVDDKIALESMKFGDRDIINLDDEALLIEYAPKLFNTWRDTETIKKVMFDFVDKFYEYKIIKNPNYIFNVLNDGVSKKYAKDSSKKVEALSTHLEEALELMSSFVYGDRVGSSIQDNLTEKLPESLAKYGNTTGDLVVNAISEIINNPKKYVKKKTNNPIARKKDEVRKYLLSLKLEGKSDEIKNFMKAIK